MVRWDVPFRVIKIPLKEDTRQRDKTTGYNYPTSSSQLVPPHKDFKQRPIWNLWEQNHMCNLLGIAVLRSTVPYHTWCNAQSRLQDADYAALKSMSPEKRPRHLLRPTARPAPPRSGTADLPRTNTALRDVACARASASSEGRTPMPHRNSQGQGSARLRQQQAAHFRSICIIT